MKRSSLSGIPPTLAPAAAVLAIVSLFAIRGHLGQWPDNVDNWTYWELSQNLVGDFYRVWAIRSYVVEPTHSITYPPFYPFLVWVADRLGRWGPASGQVVNIVAVGAFAWLSARVGRSVAGSSAAGLVAAAATLCFLPFTTEIFGARTQPVALALTTAIALLVVSGPVTAKRSFSIGLLSGLAALTRPDAIAAGVVLGLLVMAWSRKIRTGVAYGAGAMLGTSPWAVNSQLRYQTIYANESRWSAGSRQPGLWSNDWVLPPGPPSIASLWDFVAKLRATADVPVELGSDLARHMAPLLAVLGVAAIAASLLHRRNAGTAHAVPGPRPDPRPLRRLATLLLLWPPLVLGIWLADYPSVRYLSGLVWNLVAILVLAGSLRLGAAARTGLPMAAAGLTLLAAVLAWRHGANVRFEEPGKVVSRVQAFESCLRAAGGSPDQRVLFARNEIHAAQLGAIAHWYSSAPPHNAGGLSGEEWGAFLRIFDFRFAVEPAPVTPTLLPLLEAEPLPGCPIPVHRVLR